MAVSSAFYCTAELLRVDVSFIFMMLFVLSLFLQDASHFKQKYLLDSSGLSPNLFWTFYSKLRELWVVAPSLLFVLCIHSLTSAIIIVCHDHAQHYVLVSGREKRSWRVEFCCSSWCRTVSPCCPTKWSPRAQRGAAGPMREPQRPLVLPPPAVQCLWLILSARSGSCTLTSARVRSCQSAGSRKRELFFK